jgi:hypothetical protein
MAVADVAENLALDWIVVREPIEIAIWGTPLMCTKHDALSILRGWHEGSTPFLSKLQSTTGVELLFKKGHIAHVVSEEFIFENRVGHGELYPGWLRL